jgi:hypothetical protein
MGVVMSVLQLTVFLALVAWQNGNCKTKIGIKGLGSIGLISNFAVSKQRE